MCMSCDGLLCNEITKNRGGLYKGALVISPKQGYLCNLL